MPKSHKVLATAHPGLCGSRPLDAGRAAEGTDAPLKAAVLLPVNGSGYRLVVGPPPAIGGQRSGGPDRSLLIPQLPSPSPPGGRCHLF